MIFSDAREQVYRWMRHALLGPPAGLGDPASGAVLNGIKPLERFQTAILFPVASDESGLDPADDEDDTETDLIAGDIGDNRSAASAGRGKRRIVPPSSVGFSCFVQGDLVELQLIPRAVRYALRKGGRQEEWQRIVLGKRDGEARSLRSPEAGLAHVREQFDLFDEKPGSTEKTARMDLLWRAYNDGWLVTVSLSNLQQAPLQERHTNDSGGSGNKVLQALNARALFEVELECVIDQGQVGPYPRADFHLLGDEEQELELRYRHHIIYAVGHGAAVDWTLQDGRVTSLRTEFLPKVEVPRFDPTAGEADGAELDIERLAAIETDTDDICAALARFVDGYAGWIKRQASSTDSLEPCYREPAARILARIEEAEGRMRAGVQRLHHDPLVACAFGLANAAMARQMRRPMPRWRPFQLAFLLLTLESAVDPDADHRDRLDLIWFPTGGGKTEAYLGLMAVVIWWRRLKYKTSGGGTTVLMRYTLRLLTKDQFRRAARLICAMELMRREQPALLGNEPVTLGLWVGSASSPNTFAEAKLTLDEAIADEQTHPPSLLVLETCPWCGTSLQVPDNFDAGAQHFRFHCTNANCDFGSADDGTLPCNVVDEALYQAPPTLLLATIDKFARLAWEERSSAFFGRNAQRPPELIIQDELHLIAGALGSVAGLYEAGLETVLRMRGIYPKYVASTATIRMAYEQVERLYGRDAAVFPPPGLDADDAYFARNVAPTAEQPGRLYVGYLAPARNRQRCLAPLAAALLSAPEALFADAAADSEALLDAWWTLLVYHGSLKGVGVSRNALRDIEERIERLQREWAEQAAQEDSAAEPTDTQVRRPQGQRPLAGVGGRGWRDQLAERLTQLTSQMSVEENARGFERLARRRDEPGCLDLALATNMVSVGLDVSRLALMVINGQPLTTAEYIQASSRVGRGDVPGIVVTNYYRDQARSLSHYEDFRAYHEAFYRFVEPTSVTPYTYQARLRALHAALVIAVRHGCDDLAANDQALAFDPDEPETGRLIEALIVRCRRADPGRGDETAAHLHRLVAQWADTAKRASEQQQRLVYAGRDRRDLRLLYSHGDKIKGEWSTLHNMRNVENTSLIKIL